MTLRIHIMTFLLVLATATGALAQEYSRGGAFNTPGYGSRAWGMAGAAVAQGADESSAFWNPAMMSLMKSSRLGASYTDLVPGTTAHQSYIAWGQILKHGPTDEPGLEYNKHAFGIIYSNLNLDLVDNLSYSENTLRLAYAFSPEYFVSFGAAFNLLVSSSDFPDFASKGTSVDAGIRVALSRRWRVGFVARNVFSQLMYDDGFNGGIDRSYTLGLAHERKHLILEADVLTQYGGIARYNLGGEAVLFWDILHLRAGLSMIQTGKSRMVLHNGVGIHALGIHVDYNVNFDQEDALGQTHRLTLSLGL